MDGQDGVHRGGEVQVMYKGLMRVDGPQAGAQRRDGMGSCCAQNNRHTHNSEGRMWTGMPNPGSQELPYGLLGQD